MHCCSQYFFFALRRYLAKKQNKVVKTREELDEEEMKQMQAQTKKKLRQYRKSFHRLANSSKLEPVKYSKPMTEAVGFNFRTDRRCRKRATASLGSKPKPSGTHPSSFPMTLRSGKSLQEVKVRIVCVLHCCRSESIFFPCVQTDIFWWITGSKKEADCSEAVCLPARLSFDCQGCKKKGEGGKGEEFRGICVDSRVRIQVPDRDTRAFSNCLTEKPPPSSASQLEWECSHFQARNQANFSTYP